MKKLMLFFFALTVLHSAGKAQTTDLKGAVDQLDKARTAEDYIRLEKTFAAIAGNSPKDWQPLYYAAFCNARTGFIYQDDGERIEPFSNRGEDQIKRAAALLDSTRQRKEIAEVYTVMSMVYRTKVFINPMTYGRKYGPVSDQYMKAARRIDPQNPRAIYVEAWTKYHTPKLWGGDKKLAKELAEKSLSLLPATSGNGPHWGKTEVEALLKKY